MSSRNNHDRQLLSKMVSVCLTKTKKSKPFTLPVDLTGSQRMLVIDSGDPVDLLFAAPVINWFHENCPEIKITLLVDSQHSDLAKSIMRVHNVLTYENRQLKLLKSDYMALSRKIQRQDFGSTILTGRQMSLERHLLAFSSGAKTRIGFAMPLSFPFINCEIKYVGEGYSGNGMLRVLASLGLGVTDCSREISLPSSDVNHAGQLIHFRKPEKDTLTVGIDPGKSKTRQSVIPETVAYLANNLAGRMKVKFLLLTFPWDQKSIERFSALLRGEVIDLVPSKGSETLALLSNCNLFLSGNTDLFHFAAALKVPTVGLFTKHDGKEWIPDHYANVKIFKGVRGEKLSLKEFFDKVEEALAFMNTVSV